MLNRSFDVLSQGQKNNSPSFFFVLFFRLNQSFLGYIDT